MGERPQSFSDLLGTWAAGLTIWAQEFLTPIVERIIAHMDEYVDSRARAIANDIVKEAIAEHRHNAWHLGPDRKEHNE